MLLLLTLGEVQWRVRMARFESFHVKIDEVTVAIAFCAICVAIAVHTHF